MELHWKNDELVIRGVPRGYRYFLADCQSKDLIQDSKEQHLANAISQGRFELRFPLKEGPFLFRARIADVHMPMYEFDHHTGVLPVQLLADGNYIQIESLEGLDEFPDPRIGIALSRSA